MSDKENKLTVDNTNADSFDNNDGMLTNTPICPNCSSELSPTKFRTGSVSQPAKTAHTCHKCGYLIYKN